MDLRPSILEEGLVAAIEWMATDFERRTGIKTSSRAACASSDVSKATQLVAYRTAQEALTNIAKHAGCDRVQIDLSDANSVLTLEIADNGRGISQERLKNPKAFGLKGLVERAKTVGGWLDVSTRSGAGTSIILTVPLDPNQLTTSQETS